MDGEKIRNWLGIYFLSATTILGGYIIIFQETILLPISKEDATSSFQIIIPTFIAQLTVIFKWFTNTNREENYKLSLPKWIVIGPPIIVMTLIITTVLIIVIDNGNSINGGEMFRNIVTFGVSIIGATTIFVVTSIFKENQEERTEKESSNKK